MLWIPLGNKFKTKDFSKVLMDNNLNKIKDQIKDQSWVKYCQVIKLNFRVIRNQKAKIQTLLIKRVRKTFDKKVKKNHQI